MHYINGLEFTSQKKLKQYVRDIVDNKIGKSNSIKNDAPQYFQLFLDLFKRHTEYPDKFNGLIDIKIQYNPKYINQLEVIIIKDNGDEDDVSVFNNCISGKSKDNLTIAMRNSIIPQILKFKNNNSLICQKCRSNRDPEVDHYQPQFIDLKKDFIKICTEPIPTEFDQNKSHSKIFNTNDATFEKLWVRYHKKNAQLRILCKKCNSSRPKSKNK